MEMTWNHSSVNVCLYKEQPIPQRPEPKLTCKVNNKEVPLTLTKIQQTQKQESPYKTFQIIPHSNIKNTKVDQFADSLADTYEESFSKVERRFFKSAGESLLRNGDYT